MHGPQDLSWAQVAAVVGEVTGRTITIEQIDEDQVRARLRAFGMSEQAVEAIVGMSAGLRADFTPDQPRTVQSTTPTTLGAWAWEHLRPALRT